VDAEEDEVSEGPGAEEEEEAGPQV